MTQAPDNPNDFKRCAFEKAAKAHADKARMDFKIMPNGEYKYLRLQFLWLGWCLAHEHEGDPTAALNPGRTDHEQGDPLL